MVSGSGTFSVSGRNKAKQDANTAAPPYTTLGRAGNTYEIWLIKKRLIQMRSFCNINTEMNEMKTVFIKKDFDDNIQENNENGGQINKLFKF